MISFRTNIIDRNNLIQILCDIQDCIEPTWGKKIKVSHGGVSNVSKEKQFLWWEINPNEIVETMQEQERVELFKIGDYDFFISNLDESETIQVCHESDIHFDVNEELSNVIRGILLRH